MNISRLHQLNARVGSIIEFSDEPPKKHSIAKKLLMAGAIGTGLHVGSNALMKGMMKPGSRLQRVGSSIFQQGVADRAAGKMIHPAIQHASDAVLGPEISYLYQTGHSLSPKHQQSLKALGRAPVGSAGEVGESLRHLATGETSPRATKAINWLHKTSANRQHKKSDWVGAAAGGLAAAVVDPVLPAINLTRTVIGHSKFGDNMMTSAVKKGVKSGATSGVKRAVMDYVGSPSIGIAEDIGAVGHHYKKRITQPMLDAAAPHIGALRQRYPGAVNAWSQMN